MEYDVIIIGAGASGLVAAIAAARQGSRVLVIEQKDKVGRKILATGNGKCNFTNRYQGPECYRSEDSLFAGRVLSFFGVEQTLSFFQELGIYPKSRDGYLYPNSEQASSIVQVLCMECKRLGVGFQLNEKVIRVVKPYFTVNTEVLSENIRANTMRVSKENDKIKNEEKEHIYRAKKLILAAGGCASSQLGSDGSGYSLAKSFGHTLIKPLPALVQLKSPEKYLKTVSGVRMHAKVRVISGQKELIQEEGEIIFTDYGISGIPVMQISRFAAKAMEQGEKVHLLLDFIPELKAEALKLQLQQRIHNNPAKNTEELLVGLFNHKLNYITIKEAGIDIYKKAGLLTEQEIDSLVRKIKEFKMLISGTNSFEQAQVTAGGISTKEVKEATLESKRMQNLYLAGELLDVDGTCGGYNLQWAWSTGYLAGSAAGAGPFRKY